MVNDVDVEVVEESAAGPEEAVEVLYLPEQLTGIPRPLGWKARSGRAMHPVAAQQNKVADFAVMDALGQFLHGTAARGLQTHSNRQILSGCGFGHLQHLARCRAVHGDRLFHEYV